METAITYFLFSVVSAQLKNITSTKAANGSFMICNAYQYYQRDKINEDEMRQERGVTRRKYKFIQGFGEETWRNKPPEEPKHTWEGSIKMYLK
jgi:hypothetical protein